MSFAFAYYSEYSLLDGACRIVLVRAARDEGMPLLPLLIMAQCTGWFYKAAKRLKGIIGCEVYVVPRQRTDET